MFEEPTYIVLGIIIVCCILAVSIVFIYKSGRRVLFDNRVRNSYLNPWFIPFHTVQLVGLMRTEKTTGSFYKLPQRPQSRTKVIGVINQNSFMINRFLKKDRITYSKKESIMLYDMKSGLTHDNLNAFGGFSEDQSKIYMIWSLCERGSLHDFIFDQTRRREVAENYEGFVLRDILRGLEYLHESSLQFHGNLTLHNCMLDSYWIVKLSDFRMNNFLVKWKSKDQIYTEDHSPIIRSRELHYFDAETKEFWKTYNTSRSEEPIMTPEFHRKADLYSFGVIFYEIYFKEKLVKPMPENPLAEEDSLLIDEENDVFKNPESVVFPQGVFIHGDLAMLIKECFRKNIKDVQNARKITENVLKVRGSIVDLMLGNLASYTKHLNRTVAERTRQLEEEKLKSDILLMELIPSSIADELRMGNTIRSEIFSNVTVMFSDIVGFTALSSNSTPDEIVAFLNGMYQRFDLIISQQGGYKMETIGDAYCVAGGLPKRSKPKNDHVRVISMIALLQREILNEFEIPHRPGQHLMCRWGFDTGKVFTGVIGLAAPRYACFGDTVFLASKLESSGTPNKIQISIASHQLLHDSFPHFQFSPRGGVNVPGHGHLLTFWLDGVNKEHEYSLKDNRDEIYQNLEKLAKDEKNNTINFRAADIKLVNSGDLRTR